MLYSKDNEFEFELVDFANSKLSQLICKKLHLMKSENTLNQEDLRDNQNNFRQSFLASV